MLKMIIADDEPKIRQGISECCDWSQMGLTVAATARNGQEFIRLCREHRPELCLVDICMPQIDGLDAIDEIRQFLPETRYIIISGHEEFEYARRAVSGKVEAYILKPIRENLLIEAIEKTVGLIRSEQSSASLLRFARKRLEEVRPLLFERFIQDWMQERHSDEELREQLKFWKLDGTGPFTVTVVEHSISEDFTSGLLDGRERVFALYRGAEELVGTEQPFFWASLAPRTSVGLFCGVTGEMVDAAWNVLTEQIGAPLGLTVRFQTRTIQSVETEFFDACEEGIHQLEKNRKVSPMIHTVWGILDQEYMDKELSLVRVAERMHTNSSYLSRLFREETGVGFSEYLIRTRIRKAIEIMSTTDARIGEISDRVGYRSQHYFSNAFKKVTGFSPIGYRSDREGEVR